MKREAPAHSAWLATFLITISVRFLPAACRERFHDEWMAELQEMACQDIALVPPALRILLCAPSVARALQSQGQNDGPQETLLERFTTATSKATVQHLILGSLLRRLREVCGISIEQSADAIRCSHAKIGQMERGQVRFKERDVSDLLMLYGVTDPPERAALLNLVREVNTPGWWHTYSEGLPIWHEPYAGLEAAASVLRLYEVQVVPGLLQTEEYAHALIRQGSAADEKEIRRWAELRVSRQEVLFGPNPPQLWAVVDEGALRRPVGGREVVRDQLQYLIEIAALPNVTLQILPFAAGPHSAMRGPFTILRFADPDLDDVVYLEQLTSALYLDKPSEVDIYSEAVEQLCLLAEPASRTKKIINEILADI